MNTLNFDWLDEIKFYGREASFRAALATLYEKSEGKPVIICETGCVRSKKHEDLMGDGGSTLVFSQYVRKFGGKLFSVDLDPEHIKTCREILEDFNLIDEVELITGDSIEFLKDFEDNVNLLYLDSFDSSLTDQSIIDAANAHQLKEIQAGFKNLRDDSLLLTDDGIRKAKLTREFVLSKGMLEYYFKDSQFLFGF